MAGNNNRERASNPFAAIAGFSEQEAAQYVKDQTAHFSLRSNEPGIWFYLEGVGKLMPPEGIEPAYDGSCP